MIFTNVRKLYLISFLYQTTTMRLLFGSGSSLYLISFLYQTTTVNWCFEVADRCILSLSYIKPQPGTDEGADVDSCILSLSYIKPQPYRL